LGAHNKNLEGITPECPLVATGLVATITINLFVNLGMVTALSIFRLLYQQGIEVSTGDPEARGTDIGLRIPW